MDRDYIIHFRTKSGAGLIAWRLLDEEEALGELLSIEHPTEAARIEAYLRENPGVDVHGHLTEGDLTEDADAVASALYQLSQDEPSFEYELPEDWPEFKLPEGSVW